MQFLKTFSKEEAGQDMIEYSLLLGFITLAAVTLYSTMNADISSIWTTASTNLGSAANAGTGGGAS